MGWVEGPFSTSRGSDLKFLEAREIRERKPQLTTWHLTQLQLPLFNQFNKNVMNSSSACESTQRMWILIPSWVRTYQKGRAPFFFVHTKPQIPPNLLNWIIWHCCAVFSFVLSTYPCIICLLTYLRAYVSIMYNWLLYWSLNLIYVRAAIYLRIL